MDLPVQDLPPILAASLIRRVDRALLELLGSLDPEAWGLPTVVSGWAVRDVAAHLLDTAARKLSLARDAWLVENSGIRGESDLAALIHRLNREGVAVYRRLSPPVLRAWLALTCDQLADFHEALDPFAQAAFPVSWAGEAASLNWFDTARELTERWHHQQQIRLAVDRPGLLEPEVHHPVLDCFLRGLPHCLRKLARPEGCGLAVEVEGPSGGTWIALRSGGRWRLSRGPVSSPLAARAVIPEHLAWRLFTKGLDRATARLHCRLEGDAELGETALSLVAIVA